MTEGPSSSSDLNPLNYNFVEALKDSINRETKHHDPMHIINTPSSFRSRIERVIE
ncbi:Hypothetical protein FKW44_015337 [Caligus rogercresseyi]|uniref:Uncharacterized protein n=1 Tax=Caligus rogercresseyi TaxID=217165 RepID=A0A7T8JZK9_CALRO|nr:Hypothetical protein FKW44_015337 [Caligus rogercresseyi]